MSSAVDLLRRPVNYVNLKWKITVVPFVNLSWEIIIYIFLKSIKISPSSAPHAGVLAARLAYNYELH